MNKQEIRKLIKKWKHENDFDAYTILYNMKNYSNCIVTNKPIVYPNTQIRYSNKSGMHFLNGNPSIFKTVNGTKYYLQVGYDGMIEVFGDEYKNVKNYGRLFNTLNKFTIFAFQISSEDADIEHKKSALTKENFIGKYGEDVGLKKWEEYKKKQAYSNTFEYKQKKYGWNKEKFKEYNNSRSVTKEHLIKRHGEFEGIRMWEEYKKKQSYTNTLEYFKNKYGDEEGENIYNNINKRKSHSYNGFLLRYKDPIIAEQKFIEFHNTVIRNRHKKYGYTFRSKIADELFSILTHKLLSLGYKEIYTGEYSEEWFIYDKTAKKITFLDFFLQETGKVIEFNGDYWHANPKIYNENEILKYPDGNKKVKDIWEKDNKKINNILKIPYINDVLVVWQKDYTENKQKIIEKCMSFLLMK